jgi:zinc transporter ZupT
LAIPPPSDQVFDSIIPEACSHGNGKLASASAIVGFLVMMCGLG